MTRNKAFNRYGLIAWIAPFFATLFLFTLALSSVFINPPESIRKPLIRRIQKNRFISPEFDPNLKYILDYKCITPSIMAWPDIQNGVSSILVRHSVRKRIVDKKKSWDNEIPALHKTNLFNSNDSAPIPVSPSSVFNSFKNFKTIETVDPKKIIDYPFISSSNGATIFQNLKNLPLENIKNKKIKYLTEISLIVPESSDLMPRILIINSCGDANLDFLAVENIYSDFKIIREKMALKPGDSHTIYVHWKEGLGNARTEFY